MRALRAPVLNPGPETVTAKKPADQREGDRRRFPLHETGPGEAVLAHHHPAKTSQPSA